MKWTVTLVAETEPGDVRTHELGQIERGITITPASLGLSIAEGKTLVAALQTAIVTAQVSATARRFDRAAWSSASTCAGIGETVQPFLTVRVHGLNETLEDGFRHWQRAFRPAANAETVPARKAA